MEPITLATIGKATLQEIFDQAARHLLDKNELTVVGTCPDQFKSF